MKRISHVVGVGSQDEYTATETVWRSRAALPQIPAKVGDFFDGIEPDGKGETIDTLPLHVIYNSY